MLYMRVAIFYESESEMPSIQTVGRVISYESDLLHTSDLARQRPESSDMSFEQRLGVPNTPCCFWASREKVQVCSKRLFSGELHPPRNILWSNVQREMRPTGSPFAFLAFLSLTHPPTPR